MATPICFHVWNWMVSYTLPMLDLEIHQSAKFVSIFFRINLTTFQRQPLCMDSLCLGEKITTWLGRSYAMQNFVDEILHEPVYLMQRTKLTHNSEFVNLLKIKKRAFTDPFTDDEVINGLRDVQYASNSVFRKRFMIIKCSKDARTTLVNSKFTQITFSQSGPLFQTEDLTKSQVLEYISRVFNIPLPENLWKTLDQNMDEFLKL